MNSTNKTTGIVLTIIGVILIIIATSVNFCYTTTTRVQNPFGNGSMPMPDYVCMNWLKNLFLFGGIISAVIGVILLGVALSGQTASNTQQGIRNISQSNTASFKFCKSCGKKYDPATAGQFCNNCGNKL
jgi:uncharacterized protein YpmB